MPVTPLLAPVMAVDISGPGHYLHLGPLEISAANLVVILLMIVVFVLAIVIPFPTDKR